MNNDQTTKIDASKKGERGESHSRVSVRSPFIWIAEQLDLNGFVSVRELSKHGHGLMDGVSTWVVVVEEISGEKNEVDLREEKEEKGELRARAIGVLESLRTFVYASSSRLRVVYSKRKGVVTHVVVFCYLQDLPEGDERVLASNGVFLEVPDVVVRGEKDFDRVTRNQRRGSRVSHELAGEGSERERKGLTLQDLETTNERRGEKVSSTPRKVELMSRRKNLRSSRS